MDAAIAATDVPQEPPPLPFEIKLTRTGGRTCGLLVPPDLTPLELLDLVYTIAGPVADEIARRNARPTIAIARAMP